MAAALPRRWQLLLLGLALAVLLATAPAAEAWTGEICGRVVCDVCGDAAIGPEDHALEGQSAGQPSTITSSPLVRIYRSPSALRAVVPELGFVCPLQRISG